MPFVFNTFRYPLALDHTASPRGLSAASHTATVGFSLILIMDYRDPCVPARYRLSKVSEPQWMGTSR